MFSIIGSGFGLYGYLPAMVGSCEQRIVLPERYRKPFSERPELARFSSHIEWRENELAALDCADGVVIAKRPIDQREWIKHCLARPAIGRLILEKPLDRTPDDASDLLDGLVRAQRIVRIGYVFRYAAWGQALLRTLHSTDRTSRVSIRWTFLAHHFRRDLRNWKRSHSAGGGALRFYGIQIIALLAEAGYHDVITSVASAAEPDEVDKWVATFSGRGLPECDVIVDSRSGITKFDVDLRSDRNVARGDVLARLENPLDPGRNPLVREAPEQDYRVFVLGKLCRSLWDEKEIIPAWYERAVGLWKHAENATRFDVGGRAREFPVCA